MELSKVNQHQTNFPLTKKQVFIKINLIALLILIALLLTSTLLMGGLIYSKINSFSQSAGVAKSDLYQTLATGWQQMPTETQGYKNLLILGVDTLNTRGNSAPLTDTIMLVSINLQTGAVVTLPLPRDLWSEDYQTKINALYAYGLDRYPSQPEKFPQQVISELTDLKIHHTLVVSMESVAEIIDLLGGININVPQSFTDEMFPRTDVDVTKEHNPQLLYETVSFNTGEQLLDGQTALKYMRSRHGDNGQNTDEARSRRQQQIISSLVQKLVTKKTLLDTNLTGQLYRYYLDNFARNLSPIELIATGKKMLENKAQFKLRNTNLKIYPSDPRGVIEHPTQSLYDGQWVYIINNLDQFKLDIKNQLLSLNEGEV